jgi:putative flippase GtrA
MDSRATQARARPSLTLRERVLYHQIHPLKLAADVSGAVASAWLLWQHRLLLGLVAAFLPAIVASAVMLHRLAFERQRDSAFGRYVAFHMTRVAEAVRFAGGGIAWVGAWFHSGWAIAAGAMVVVLGWTYSLPRWWSRHPA